MMPVNCEGPYFSYWGGEGRGGEACGSPGFRPFIGRLKFQRIVMQIRASSRRLLRRTGGAILFLGVTPVLGLCSTGSAQAVGSPDQSGASGSELVTFNKDVAPIIFQHCSNCHGPGQAAPFSLLGYADAKKHAKQIAEVVRKRYMPPWLPEKGTVEFAGDLSLTDDQVRLISKWAAQGALEGVASRLPPLPKWAEGWQLGTPDLVVKVPQPYTLAAEAKDVYHNLVVPIPVSERKYIKGVELQPGNRKVVHHALVTVDATPVCRLRAAKENPPGFDGMLLPETAQMPDGYFLGWAPGKIPQFTLPGMAWSLQPGSDLALQMHLHPSGKAEQVQPSVAFYFTDEPPTNSPLRINLEALRIDIPAGNKDYSVEDEYTLPVEVTLLAIGPHAHYLGKRVEAYARSPDGTRRELLLIKDWDFNWQSEFRYAKPITLPRGATLTMRWVYDNSTNNVRNPNQPPKRVRLGPQTTDEMAEVWFQLLPRSAEERRLLQRDYDGHLANLQLDYNESLVAENPNDAVAHTKAGRANIYFGDVGKAMNHFLAAVKADPKYDRAYFELGSIYLRQQRLPEAREAFENVRRFNPDDYEAEGSLGIIFLRLRELDQAEIHFRAALRINPDDKLASNYLGRVLEAKAKPKN